MARPERLGSGDSLLFIGDRQRTPAGEVTLRQSQVEQGGESVRPPWDFTFSKPGGRPVLEKYGRKVSVGLKKDRLIDDIRLPPIDCEDGKARQPGK